jgi:hypothetical protein
MTCLGEEPNTIKQFESTIWGVHVNYVLFQNITETPSD